MDVFTHVLLGYAAGIILFAALGRPSHASATSYGLVAAASAFAPDLDAFVAPLSYFDSLYWLQHRGASHSLLGAPVAAWLFVRLLGRLSRRWNSLSAARWWPGAWRPLLLGAWSHLLLDGITHHGIPLFWPLSPTPWSLEWYYWIVWWLAPPAAGVLWLRWRRHWSDARVLQAGAVIVLVLLVLGGVRVLSAPDGDTYATRHPLEWIVVDEQAEGTRVDLMRGDTVLDSAWYPWHLPAGSTGAVAAIRQTSAYDGFLMASIGPLVWQIEASAHQDGGWNITLLDVVQRFEARSAPFSSDFAREASELRATVDESGVHFLR